MQIFQLVKDTMEQTKGKDQRAVRVGWSFDIRKDFINITAEWKDI